MSNLHDSIKKTLGYKRDVEDKTIITNWEKRTTRICKPCWELKYCPYGPLVEQFPLLPILLTEAEEHNMYLKKCLANGKLPDGKILDSSRRLFFKNSIESFRRKNHPITIPQVLKDASCKVFGHVCPVFLIAEPLTETKDQRTHTRQISRETMIKVVRRDGQICQKCNVPVPDKEVEFDHIIPFSNGGTTTPENLRLVHRKCNRKRGSSVRELLSLNPLEYFWKGKTKRKA
jgi:hypothetical protein